MKLNFQDQSQLYASYMFNIIPIYSTYLLLQLLSCGIRVYIPNLATLQNGRIIGRKNDHILLTIVLFEAYLPILYVNCLFYILIIFGKCILVMGASLDGKKDFAKNCSFLSLISRIKIGFTTIAYFIF